MDCTLAWIFHASFVVTCVVTVHSLCCEAKYQTLTTRNDNVVWERCIVPHWENLHIAQKKKSSLVCHLLFQWFYWCLSSEDRWFSLEWPLLLMDLAFWHVMMYLNSRIKSIVTTKIMTKTITNSTWNHST